MDYKLFSYVRLIFYCSISFSLEVGTNHDNVEDVTPRIFTFRLNCLTVSNTLWKNTKHPNLEWNV